MMPPTAACCRCNLLGSHLRRRQGGNAQVPHSPGVCGFISVGSTLFCWGAHAKYVYTYTAYMLYVNTYVYIYTHTCHIM